MADPDREMYDAGLRRAELMADMPSEEELQAREDRVRANAARQPRCSQCGRPFTERACGPTHALIATEDERTRSPEGPHPSRESDFDRAYYSGSREDDPRSPEGPHPMDPRWCNELPPHTHDRPSPASPEGPDAERERADRWERSASAWRKDCHTAWRERDEARERADRQARDIGNLCATADEYVAEMRTLTLHPEAAVVLSVIVTLVNRTRAALSRTAAEGPDEGLRERADALQCLDAVQGLCDGDAAHVRWVDGVGCVPIALLRAALSRTATEGEPHADASGLTPETCPQRGNHGSPFRYCPVKGCGWHEGMQR